MPRQCRDPSSSHPFFFKGLNHTLANTDQQGLKMVTEFCSDQPIIVAPLRCVSAASCTDAYVGNTVKALCGVGQRIPAVSLDTENTDSIRSAVFH
jgi:hypothetical protein